MVRVLASLTVLTALGVAVAARAATSGPEGPVTGVDAPITGAANSLLQAGILGALVLLLGAFSFYAVWQWNKTNEARVKDQKEMAKTLIELTGGLKDALREVNGTIDALKEAVKANTTASMAMERTVNDTVRDAVRAQGYRRMSPAGGTPAPGGSRG